MLIVLADLETIISILFIGRFSLLRLHLVAEALHMSLV